MTAATPSVRRVRISLAIIVAGLGAHCGDKGTGPTPPTNTNPPAVAALSVSPTSVTGGSVSQGTVSLSVAPASATSVSLSSNSTAASVQGSVTVNSGSTTGSFTINTTPVSSVTNATISASLNNTSQSATLTVNPPAAPPLAANFKVTSLSDAFRKGNSTPVAPAGSEDACPLTTSTQAFDCEFNGTDSTTPAGPITEYRWTYYVGARMRPETSTTPRYKPRELGCGFFGGNSASTSGGLVFIAMRVDLQVKDSAGNLSAVKTNQNVRVFPNGACGYGF